MLLARRKFKLVKIYHIVVDYASGDRVRVRSKKKQWIFEHSSLIRHERESKFVIRIVLGT